MKEIGNSAILTKEAKEIRYGLDYLRFNFQRQIPFLDRVLKMTGSENSHFYFDEENEFMYTHVKLSTGPALMISCIYDEKPVPIIMYNVFENGIKSVYARMDFYGSYFRLEEIGYFKAGFYKDFIDELTPEDPTITRVDYCLDLFYDQLVHLPKPGVMLPSLSVRDFKGVKRGLYTFAKGGKDESRASGSSNSKRNIIRMYDKLADLEVKGKFFLYNDYLKRESVHRYEVQFGPSFTRGFFLSSFDTLLLRIANLFKISSLALDGPLFYEYSNNHTITDYNKLIYTKQFSGRARKFFDSGINPFLVLMDYFDKNCLKQTQIEVYKGYLMALLERLHNHDLVGFISK